MKKNKKSIIKTIIRTISIIVLILSYIILVSNKNKVYAYNIYNPPYTYMEEANINGFEGINGTKIVDNARKWKNFKYVYGGKNPETGMDCSGWATLIYKNYLGTASWGGSLNNKKWNENCWTIPGGQLTQDNPHKDSNGNYWYNNAIEKKPMDKYGILLAGPGGMTTGYWAFYFLQNAPQKIHQFNIDKNGIQNIEYYEKIAKKGDIVIFYSTKSRYSVFKSVHMGISTGGRNIIHNTANTAGTDYFRVVETDISGVTNKSGTQIVSFDLISIGQEEKKGNLKIIKKGEDGERLNNVNFKIQRKDDLKWVQAANGKATGYTTSKENATTFRTNSNGEFSIKDIESGTYTIYETYNPNFGYIVVSDGNMGSTYVEADSNKTTTKEIKNIRARGNLIIEKVNSDDTSVKLKDTAFKIKCKDNGKWVKRNGNSISYVEESQAETMKTDHNGKITVNNLIVGNYEIKEIETNNYGYVIVTPSKNVTIKNKNTSNVQIKNKQKYIKISGYVWEDIVLGGKELYRNNLFDEGKENKLKDIKVSLKEGNKVIKSTKTDNKGNYLFKDVEIEKLSDYYIEFEYDGLIYQSVTPTLNKTNGSKSNENSKNRQDFNDKFAKVEGKGGNLGVTFNKNGKEEHNLKYEKKGYISKLIHDSQYTITSNTKEASYIIKNQFKWGEQEITNVNLGIYRREQPNLALINDIVSAKAIINGKSHIYKYDKKFVDKKEDENIYDAKIKFDSKYANKVYKKSMYKADYETKFKEKNKELKLSIIYKVEIQNSSTTLKAKVNNIVNYNTPGMKIVKVGRELDDNLDKISKEIKFEKLKDEGKYNKIKIDTSDVTLDGQKRQIIYIEFEVDRKTVEEKINEKMNNVSEINSYSIYDEQNRIYAGIDINSNPGNTIPGEKNNYEDDTDECPGFKIVKSSKTRTLKGNIFEDKTKVNPDGTRSGNGKFDKNENKVTKVKVTLKEKDKNLPDGTIKKGEKEYNIETKENGEYIIEGFVPGEYNIIYTWGNNNDGKTKIIDKSGNTKEINVNNYKSTIVDENNWKEKNNNKYWYRENTEEKESDAIDNYEKRIQMDEKLKEIKFDTKVEEKTMESTTPTMDLELLNKKEKYTEEEKPKNENEQTKEEDYVIENIDLGIAERPHLELQLDKRITSVKLKTAFDQELVNAEIDQNGKVTGERKYMTYMKGNPNRYPKNGWIKLEIDKELIHGSIININYVMTMKNTSDLEFINKEFYNYGTEKYHTNPLRLIPVETIDYMDKDWSYKIDKGLEETIWNRKEIKDIRNNYLLSTEVIKSLKKTDKTILSNLNTRGEELIAGQTKDLGKLTVNKILSNTDDIKLDNEAEIIHITKNGGGNMYNQTPGNYIPGSFIKETSENKLTELDDDMAETIYVAPATGENRNYTLNIILGIILLTGAATGIIITKRKLKNNKT